MGILYEPKEKDKKILQLDFSTMCEEVNNILFN